MNKEDTMNAKNASKSKQPSDAPAVKESSVEPLEPCDKPHVAEATRTKEVDEACDDGVH